MKKVVFKVEWYNNQAKTEAMKKISGLSAVELISMDMKANTLTVTGDIDPVKLVRKLRKFGRAVIVTGGPSKEPEKMGKAEEEEPEKQEEEKKDAAELSSARKAYKLLTFGQVALDWVFILTNLALEILMLIFNQIASPRKPQYALIAVVVAFAVMLICIAELVCRGHKHNVGLGGWLQSYTWIEFFSFLGAISQCVFTIVGYIFLRHAVENPIKLSLVSAIFIVCMAASKLVNNPRKEILPDGQNIDKEHTV